MPLTRGTRFGRYEIIDSLGAGGMGEVYRGRDADLQRDVAIKVLPESFTDEPDRLLRFEREARTLAALNHPNIAIVFGLEKVPSADGTSAIPGLVMELVDGPTLADHIAAGPLAIDDALGIARQIAEAIEAAHEQGIVHRDLKPANVKVRPDGTVKVLDFGLARALDSAAVSGSASLSPTITSPAMTRLGVILGTAAYMSPEQAKGKPVDRRADMWAFGCLLYEMLTGRRAFGGDEIAETFAEIIKGEPKWDLLPAGTPTGILRLIRRCLVKDPKGRLSDAAVARIEIDESLAAPQIDATRPAVSPRWRRLLPIGLLVAAVAVAAGVAGWWMARTPTIARVPTRVESSLPSGVRLDRNARQHLAISRDGRLVVFAGVSDGARTGLYVRDMSRWEAERVRGVENSGSIFLSPDGKWIGYYETSGDLRRVPVGGGPSEMIAKTTAVSAGFRGATWGAGVVVFATTSSSGLFSVPDTGGMPTQLTFPKEGEHRDPVFLPDGRTLLLVIENPPARPQIAVASLDDPEPTPLLPGRVPRYAESGHLLFEHEGSLWAVRFDQDTRVTIGTPLAVQEDMVQAGAGETARAIYDVSGNGTLVYAPPESTDAARTLVWIDRNGREQPVPGAPMRTYVYARLSPDQSRLALDIRDGDQDIFLWDLRQQGERELTRFTFDPALDAMPVWAPRGDRIVWVSERSGSLNLYMRATDGTGPIEQLTDSRNRQRPSAFTPDGQHVIFSEEIPARGHELMMLPLRSGARPTPLVSTMDAELNGEISPDGRWLAFESNYKSGTYEVWVRPYPRVHDGEWQVTIGGGRQPAWAMGPRGLELFYLQADGLYAAVVTAGATGGFKTAPRVKVSANEGFYIGAGANRGRTYDVTEDGRRILRIRQSTVVQRERQKVRVVENWFEELNQRVPLTR